MTVRELRVRARRTLATLSLAAAGIGPMAILPMSIDHFLRPVHVGVVAGATVKECPNAQKRASIALKSERRTKKEPRGLMRWLL